MDDAGPRFQAARWVIRLGRLHVGLVVVVACWSLLGVPFLGAAALVVPLALSGWAAACGALVRAFAAHRRGAWQLLLAFAVAGVLGPLGSWLLTGPPTASGLVSAVLSAGLLALLLHDDCRDWVDVDPRRRPVVARPGDTR